MRGVQRGDHCVVYILGHEAPVAPALPRGYGVVEVDHAVVPVVVVDAVVIEVGHIDGAVADAGHAGLAGGVVLGDLQVEYGGDVRVLVVLAGQQVAEAVADKGAALGAVVKLHRAHLHRLRHAAVPAYYHVRAGGYQTVGDLILQVARLRGHLGAPGHEHEHQVDPGLARGGDVAVHELIVYFRAAGEVVRGADAGGVLKAADRHAVGVAGVGQEGHGYAVDVHHRAVAGFGALGLGAIGAHVSQPRGVQRVQRVIDAVLPGVGEVAGGRVDQVEAHGGDRACDRGRRAEKRIGRVRAALRHERGHQGAHGVVRVGHQVGQHAEDGRVVIAALGLSLAV